MKRGFQEFVVTQSPLPLFKNVKFLSFSLIVLSLFISSASLVEFADWINKNGHVTVSDKHSEKSDII